MAKDKDEDNLQETFDMAQKIIDKPGKTDKDLRQLNKLIEWMSQSVIKDIEKEKEHLK